MSSVPQYRPPSLGDADDSYESTVVPFNRRGRGGAGYDGEASRATPRRSSHRDADVPADERRSRRPRRRSFEQPPWLWQAVSGAMVVIVLLGAYVVTRFQEEQTPTETATQQSTQPNDLQLAPVGEPASSTGAAAPPSAPQAAPGRQVQASVKTLEANYTVVAGDTLGAIAARFNTTTERIQAFNNLSDPRLLNIDQKLVIPPPL